MSTDRIEEILQFWFLDIDEDTVVTKDSIYNQRWFGKNAKFDAEIKKLFESDIKRADLGEYDAWIEDPRGRLALILLFDQFPRNIYRNTKKAFSYDLKALELCLKSLKDGFDGRVNFVERVFYYMPLMHSENLEVQETSVKTFTKLVEEASRYEDPNIEYFKSNLEYAQRHHDIYKEFRRFPHRNDALGRRSTSDERAFLMKEGAGF